MGAVHAEQWQTLVDFAKRGKCDMSHDGQQCGGPIKLYHYVECGQYWIGCEKCGETIGRHIFPMPISPANANMIAKIIERKSVLLGHRFSNIRNRFIQERWEEQKPQREIAMSIGENQIKAIPTTYNGINFRSRLEAKWARFFDMAGWRYEYEPEDFGGYIPDFVLLFKDPVYVEVKPVYSSREAQDKCSKAATLAMNTGRRVLCLGATVGYHGDPKREEISTGSRFVLGWCFGDEVDSIWAGTGENNVLAAEAIICACCKNLSFFLHQGNWTCAVCGDHHKHYWKADQEAAHIGNTVLNMWQKATNSTQYVRHHVSGIVR